MVAQNKTILLILFLLINVLASQTADAQGLAKKKALAAAKDGDWAKAIEIYDKIISQGGATNSDYERRSWALKNAGQYDRAIQDLFYLSSRVSDRTHKINYYKRIIIIEKERSNDSGYEVALNRYTNDVKSSDAYIERAEYFESKRRFKEAIDDYSKVHPALIKEGETHAVYKYLYRQKIYYLKLELGMVKVVLADINDLERDYSLNMGMNPNSNQYTSAWLDYLNIDRGNAYNYLGDYESAQANLNAGLKPENPANEWAYYYLGEMEMFKGNYPEALDYFDKVKLNQELFPYWKARTMSAYCFSELNRNPEAIASLRVAEASHRKNSWAKESDFNTINSIKAYVFYKNGFIKEGLDLIKQAVSSEPNNQYLLLIQARLQSLEGDKENALASLSASLKNNMSHSGYLDLSYGDLRQIIISDSGRALVSEYNISSPLFTAKTSSSIPGEVKITSQGYSGQERRLALVIGNGTYQHGGMLANPENDARDISTVLKHLGFDVMTFENQSQNDMKMAVDEFGRRLKEYDVGLFFYAGHGLQAKGTNYLVPTDALIENESDVEFTCLDAGRVLTRMEDADNRINIIILDACRDNPFERSWTRSSKGRGLARMDAPTGSIIAYATEPGNTASDGSGRNGLYTSALLEEMQKPDVIIERVFRQVRTRVIDWSEKKQTPWESTSLTGDFFFNK